MSDIKPYIITLPSDNLSLQSVNPESNHDRFFKFHNFIINKNDKKISFLIVLSIIIIFILLFFISYKIYIFSTVNNIDIGIFPNTNDNEFDGYDINYLSEQVYFKNLSDKDKDVYLSLPDYEKEDAIKKYLISQIFL